MVKAKNDTTPMEQAAESIGWQEAAPDFADVHDFDDAPVLEGIYVATKTVETDDVQHPGQKRPTALYEISIDGTDNPDSRRAVWGTAALDQKMKEIAIGSRVRIEYRGKEQFRGSDGSTRQIRRFRVQFAPAK